MGLITALSTNSWSSIVNNDPWPGGIKPGVGDTVRPGNFVVTIDEDITVDKLESDGVDTGYFVVSGTRIINADIDATAGASGSPTAGLVYMDSALESLTINGNINGGTVTGVTIDNATNLTVVGNITGSIVDNTTAYGVYAANLSGTIDITGNIQGGASNGGGSCHGVNISSMPGTGITINGNILGGSISTNNGVYLESISADVSIVGNVTGGDYEECSGINLQASLPTISFTITGNIAGGTVMSTPGILNGTDVVIVINGDLSCGASGQSPVSGVFRLMNNIANTFTVIDETGSPVVLSQGSGASVLAGSCSLRIGL